MADIFNSEDSVFFVGGRGAKNGDANAGGGAAKADWEGSLNKNLANVMGINGEPLSNSSAWNGSQSACDVYESGGGWVRIGKTGMGWFAACKVGVIANVQFAGVYTSGRYRVKIVGNDYIELDYVAGGAGSTTCDVKVGSAFDKLQTALDNTDANAGSPHNVDILTNKAETFSDIGDRIDVDTGGGDGLAGTWKRIIGVDDDGVELASGSYVTIDGNNQACHVFYINNIANIQFRHIYAKDAGSNYYDFAIIASTASKGYLLKDCKTTGGKYGVYAESYHAYMISIEGGYYSSSGGRAVSVYQARYIHLKNVELVGATLEPLIYGYVAGSLILDGCVLRKTAVFSAGVISNYPTTFPIISNCVFYNIDNCIQLNDNDTKLIQYNNIFVLHTAASGKIITRTKGSVLYSDYSCAWAIDGAPVASDRWGGTGLPEHSIEQDPQFVDADNGDFRPRNPNVLRGGKPDIADNETEMGAILQKYQFAKRAKAANPGRLQIMR